LTDRNKKRVIVYDEIRQWVFFTPLRFNGKFPAILLVTWKQRRMSCETFWHPVHHAHFLHLVILRIQYLCIEAGWSWQVPFLDAGPYIILPSLLNSYFSKSLTFAIWSASSHPQLGNQLWKNEKFIWHSRIRWIWKFLR